ncbi:DctP family TRAP transporter solute-binding subunit [Mesobacillus maritimus]|uniref:DctP family TRAP transporter solute-binding subunit n=1 Tax=Mesobacillus maritimus TaxID=1643336 RepID=UPI00203F6985|nr:DctP family TRAP transporter solute-binding subunit [Mesobacillus maritimus]MCM3588781.1 DctP family TRAP transporter solute-binding subunit [Mesobacillus maritimus]MCM3671907.1 DctP family TRAP transporter solute-binding subunit [Mesobacillus maritimus]
MTLTLGLFLAACGNNEEASSESSGSDGGSSEFESATWRFVTEEVQGQVQYVYAEEFAKRISEKTDGKITVEPYEYGGLGTETDQVAALQGGAVELAVMSPGFTGNMVMEGQIFALHFLFPDSVEKTQEILNTSEALNVDLVEKYEAHGITPLAFWTEGAMAWTSNAGVSEPGDFKGFKMRIQESPLMQESYKAYGASPQALPWSELYTALDRGTVDGQENPVFFIYDAAFNEVQDTVTLSNHNNYVAMTTVNTDWYNSQPENVQKLISETVKEMQDWAYDEQDRQNTEFLEKMKNDTDNPVEIIELTEEQRSEFRELALPIRDYYRENISTVEGAILDKLEEEIEAAK